MRNVLLNLMAVFLVFSVQGCWADASGSEISKDAISMVPDPTDPTDVIDQKSIEPDAIDPCSKYDRINMAKCLDLRIDEVDKELENTIDRLVESLWDKESEEALRKAQEAWLKFIQLDCKFQKPNKGGREWRLAYSSCLLKHQKERVRQLKAIPSCGNGCIY